ncbi:MAG: VWA domain-containing protein [Synechococcaceae cyanobacterium]|nr:VWA domain-containing protein [Synechococcaceae cyanobacterium]
MPFPAVRLASRPLHFLYLCDCSGSMAARGKMQALNQAIRESLPGMVDVARRNPEARLLVRAVSFADSAAWHIASPTPVEELVWRDLQAGGVTAMGEALELVAAALRSPPMEERALPPVLVLISDGQPTDDVDRGLRSLLAEPWGQKAVRLAIAMGHDADLEVLQQFIGPGTAAGPDRSPRRPLQAGNATSLARYIQWASTAVVGAASMPASRVAPAPSSEESIPLPDLPPTVMDPTDDVGPLVW